VNPFGHSDDAFTTYVLPELGVLRRVSRALAGQPADADDLVQETLLRAFLAIGRFDGRHPRAWLLTILRNVARSWHRQRPPLALDEPTADGVNSHWAGPSAEQLVIDATFDADVTRAFRALPTIHRQIIVLIDLQGLDCGEAAEWLRVPVGTVMSRLHRARHRMRRQLHCDRPPEDRA
jgi:RNA polymerase sigma-70 factor (ECF subfamily)